MQVEEEGGEEEGAGLLGSVDPSFRALSGRLELTVRLHTFNKDYLSAVCVYVPMENTRIGFRVWVWGWGFRVQNGGLWVSDFGLRI